MHYRFLRQRNPADCQPGSEDGVFPLPNDTKETTNTLSGIDAAICVSAQATDEEKEAAYRFLAYLAEPENAQIFCDNDGAPPVSQA